MHGYASSMPGILKPEPERQLLAPPQRMWRPRRSLSPGFAVRAVRGCGRHREPAQVRACSRNGRTFASTKRSGVATSMDG